MVVLVMIQFIAILSHHQGTFKEEFLVTVSIIKDIILDGKNHLGNVFATEYVYKA